MNNEKRIIEESRKQVANYIKYKVYSFTSIVLTISWFVAWAVLTAAVICLLMTTICGYIVVNYSNPNVESNNSLKSYVGEIDKAMIWLLRSLTTTVLSALYVFVVWIIIACVDGNAEKYKKRFKGEVKLQH